MIIYKDIMIKGGWNNAPNGAITKSLIKLSQCMNQPPHIIFVMGSAIKGHKNNNEYSPAVLSR